MTEHGGDFGDGGLWLTLTELAKREGLGKPTVSEKVTKYEAAGLLKTKPGKGRTKLINLAQWVRANGNADPAKLLAAEMRADDAASAPAAPPDSPDKPQYRDSQARKTAFEADLKELELREKLGELIPVTQVEDAATRAGEIIVAALDRMASRADEMAAAVGRDGVPGARAKFKEISSDLRQTIADAMTVFSRGEVSPPGDTGPAS